MRALLSPDGAAFICARLLAFADNSSATYQHVTHIERDGLTRGDGALWRVKDNFDAVVPVPG